MNYTIPKFDGDWSRFDLRKFNAEINRAHQENHKLYQTAVKLHCEIIKNASNLWGSKSRQLAYLRREAPESPPDLIKKAYNPIIKKYKKWLEAEEKKAKSRDYRQRVKQNIQLLEELGYEPGQHFKSSSAISFAREVVLYDDAGNPISLRGLPEPKG